jgi:hypothetical protein
MTAIGDDSRIIRAPWTDEQVAALNRFQTGGRMHPFTCRHRDQSGHVERPHADLGQLVATRDGWTCPDCGYTQDWAHRMMVEPQGGDDDGQREH